VPSRNRALGDRQPSHEPSTSAARRTGAAGSENQNLATQSVGGDEMTSDLDRLLRAVRTLAKIARTYDTEHLLDVLGQYATLKQEGEVTFVGAFLDEIGQELCRRSP